MVVSLGGDSGARDISHPGGGGRQRPADGAGRGGDGREASHRDGPESRIARVAGTTVTTLDPPVPFAYAVDRVAPRLILSTSPGAIVRYLESSADPKAGERFGRLRAAAFADAVTYACVDLDAVKNLAGKHRGSPGPDPGRPPEAAGRLKWTATSRMCWPWPGSFGPVSSRAGSNADATAVHRSVGLIRQDQDDK